MQIKQLFQVLEIKKNQYTKYIQIFENFLEYFIVNQV
jgi:galactose-1-phosphate uridylyltransferase